MLVLPSDPLYSNLSIIQTNSMSLVVGINEVALHLQTARRLKLRNISEFSELSGGRAIEILAQSGNPQHYDLVSVMSQQADCNFSFSGLKSAIGLIIESEEERQGSLFF